MLCGVLLSVPEPGYATPTSIDGTNRTMPADPLFDEAWEENGEGATGFPDPLEGLNRRTLRLNQSLDRWFFNPVVKAYGWVLPNRVKRAVRRVLANFNSPAVVINDLLQREWTDAATAVARFTVNSSVGIGGIFDAAQSIGLEEHISDFGQTLALGGVVSGPYIVLPAFGPITARDGIGLVVDTFLRPTTLIFGPGGTFIIYSAIHGTTAGIAIREAKAEAIEALEESSVDYYAALRHAYYQNRTAQIWDRREHHRDALEQSPANGSSRSGVRCHRRTVPRQHNRCSFLHLSSR
jgi:phospholipid-binding lipoprotein MlaA